MKDSHEAEKICHFSESVRTQCSNFRWKEEGTWGTKV